MKFFIFLCIFALSLGAEDNTKKVVFELTSGNVTTFEKRVLSGVAFHKVHYENNLESLDVSVVIHGEAYKFFLKDLSISRYKDDKKLAQKHEDFRKRIESLSSIYDVEFLICASGVKRLEIDKENIYDFVKVVATSTVALIDKQADAYSYIPIF